MNTCTKGPGITRLIEIIGFATPPAGMQLGRSQSLGTNGHLLQKILIVAYSSTIKV
jgi:hypothetical protein